MPGEIVIRSVRDDELAAVLGLWRAAGVTPPSISDSIEGLTRLNREPAALLLIATINSGYSEFSVATTSCWDRLRSKEHRSGRIPKMFGRACRDQHTLG